MNNLEKPCIPALDVRTVEKQSSGDILQLLATSQIVYLLPKSMVGQNIPLLVFAMYTFKNLVYL